MDARRIARAWLRRQAAWKQTGNGTRVGLFIPLPEEIAGQFPSLESKDDSPPHVTLLYIGEVPKARQDEFVDIIERVLGREPGPIRATLGEPDSFLHADDEDGVERVVFCKIRFSRDVGSVRDRLRSALLEADFQVADSFPRAYTPHTTLAYLQGQDARYVGTVPKGTWLFDHVAVWGLTKAREVPFGAFVEGRNFGVKPMTQRWASDLEAAWSTFLLL